MHTCKCKKTIALKRQDNYRNQAPTKLDCSRFFMLVQIHLLFCLSRLVEGPENWQMALEMIQPADVMYTFDNKRKGDIHTND